MYRITKEICYFWNLVLSMNTLGASELLGTPWQRRVAMAEVSSVWSGKLTYMVRHTLGLTSTWVDHRWPCQFWVKEGIYSATHILCVLMSPRVGVGRQLCLYVASQVLFWVESQAVRGQANHWGTTELTMRREEEEGQPDLTFNAVAYCI